MRSLFSPEDKTASISLRQLAKKTGYAYTTIYGYVKRGELAAYRQGKGKGRRYKVTREVAEIFWANMHEAQNA